MELLLSSSVILSFMFGPKLFILLSYEAVLIECPVANPGLKLEDEPPYVQSSSGDGSCSSPDTESTKSTVLSGGSAAKIYAAAVVRKKSKSKRIYNADSAPTPAPGNPVPFSLEAIHRLNPIFQQRIPEEY